MTIKWKIEGQIHSCSLPMSVGKYPVNLHFVFFHLVYVNPQIPAGRIRWTIYPRNVVIVIRVLLNAFQPLRESRSEIRETIV